MRMVACNWLSNSRGEGGGGMVGYQSVVYTLNINLA